MKNLTSITLITLLALIITACDQPYSPEEEKDFDTEIIEILDTEEENYDTDCLSSKACTVVWAPECKIMDNADQTPILRHYWGCICLDGTTHPVIEDQICTGSCYDNPNGANYCIDKNGVIE